MADIVQIVFRMAFPAALCAGIAWYAVACIGPALRARGARTAALAIAGALTLITIVSYALMPVVSSQVVMLAGLALLMAIAVAPDALIRVTGGPRRERPEVDEVAGLLRLAYARLEAGDRAGWHAAVDRVQSARDPAAADIKAAIAEYAREADQGIPPRSATQRRLQDETQRYLFGVEPPRIRVIVGVTLLAAVVGLTPSLASRALGWSVCDRADRAAVGSIRSDGAPSGGDLADVLLVDPGPDFTLVVNAPLSLERAAATRVDPETLRQLEAAGFESAFRREWLREDGTGLGNDVFAFATADGALAFQRAVTNYACRYSSEAFDVPGGGVGLRINYGSGDPVRDQVAWLEGNLRVLIAIGYKDAPSGHAEVLELVARARQGLP